MLGVRRDNNDLNSCQKVCHDKSVIRDSLYRTETGVVSVPDRCTKVRDKVWGCDGVEVPLHTYGDIRYPSLPLRRQSQQFPKTSPTLDRK